MLRYIAKKFSGTGKRRRFLNFARLVAFISVILGSMALIISLSVLYGFESTLRDNAVKFTSHIKLRNYLNEPINDVDKVSEVLKNNFKSIKSFAPVVEREGLISSGSFVEGVVIRGTKPEYDITAMHKNIVDGKFYFSNPNAVEVIIGKRLAKKLKARIGSKLTVYAIKGEALKKFNMPEIEKFTVSGIYETGMAQYDDIYIYIPYARANELFKMPANSATSYDILLHDINEAPTVAKEINFRLGYPFYSYTVFDLHSAIFAWIEMQKAPIPLVLGLISIVAVFNIITILLITVVEKTHSIGILRALGISRRDIIKIFIIQGLTIGTIGTLIGCGIGFLSGWIQQTYHVIKLEGDVYFLDTLPVKFELWHFAIVILTSVFLSFMATLVPSFIASRIQPIKAIRFK